MERLADQVLVEDLAGRNSRLCPRPAGKKKQENGQESKCGSENQHKIHRAHPSQQKKNSTTASSPAA